MHRNRIIATLILTAWAFAVGAALGALIVTVWKSLN